MGRAEDLFDRLVTGGKDAIDQLILDREAEQLFLDFKRSADGGNGSSLHPRDRANFAEAVSGFANSEGGVIVWGVECNPKSDAGDVATAKVPVQSARRFLSFLEAAVSGCTLPPHPGVRHHAVEDEPGGPGYVISYVPQSPLAPHQAQHTKPHYYVRAGSSFLPATHGHLAGMFGRRPQPRLTHAFRAVGNVSLLKKDTTPAVSTSVQVLLGSLGPGIARDIYVVVRRTTAGPEMSAAISGLGEEWTLHGLRGEVMSVVSMDAFKLPPGVFVSPVRIGLAFWPPFERDLTIELSYGHSGSPTASAELRIPVTTIEIAYERFKAEGASQSAAIEFVSSVMAGVATEPEAVL